MENKKNLPPHKKSTNYIFFYSFFFLLLFFDLITSLHQHSFLLFFSGVSQTLLEASLLIFLSLYIKTALFPILIFFLLFIHTADAFILILMDNPISYVYSVLFSGGLKNLAIAIRAANIDTSLLLLVSACILFLPLLFLFLYRLSAKKQKLLSLKLLVYSGIFFFASFCLFDTLSYKSLSPLAYTSYAKRLPLKFSLYTPSFYQKQLSMLSPLKQETFLTLKKKPNIYLFILESFRKDLIDPAITPTLYALSQKTPLEKSYSNANASQLSWYSIFFASPLHWNPKERGSPFLKLIKNLGYKISVYSSAELTYFDMDEMLFGRKRELLDDFVEDCSPSACKRDETILNALEEHINEEGHLFIIFLDSTHSEYSYPKDSSDKFSLILLPFSSKDRLMAKNRYKNAASYLDRLLSKTLSKIQKKPLLIITGDHGEEFYEEASFFHGTHLNDSQLSVPLIFSFPTEERFLASFGSHIDIFPTLLHYLCEEKVISEGETLFSPKKKPYLAAQQNGAKTPTEFFLRTESETLLFHYDKNIFRLLSKPKEPFDPEFFFREPLP